MTVFETLLPKLASYLITPIFATAIIHFLFGSIYRIYFHPLSSIPGPLLPKMTSLWLYYHSCIGDEATVIHTLHSIYGDFLRVSPNEVDIRDPDAVAPIYITKGGFLKAPCYGNFDIDGHKTIFSTIDPEYRAPRAKAVLPMFSMKYIRNNEFGLYRCVDRMVERMVEEKRTGKPVNVLNLARSLAVDAVSTHLFQKNYKGIGEKGARLSASAFVDAFVAVGRFFYLPNTAFLWLEWASGKIFIDEYTTKSMEAVDRFVDDLVSSTSQGADHFPGRLMGLNLSKSELKCQCKDLIFAGTDSTGMNLATICHHLALNPSKYEILHDEITTNNRLGTSKLGIQSLPYLSSVIKEALRISMANPTRLPRIVPPSGWSFKSHNFPGGTRVGISSHELHFNASVFPNPYAFQPERWLPENATSEMNRSSFAFGAGSRQCIARNLATVELYMATEKLVEKDVLRNAKVVQKEIEIYEWFNSRVKGEKIELLWS